ncbi:M23 family metallopeptidase [Robbsia sp. KACC 23696]|uniref:M23 family metallopeptidase n=1 Tax=Robbsia sp. KACC 23696 TaxID=3149231 RepID=UPI00325B163C
MSVAVFLSACSSAPPVGPGFYRVERGDNLSSIAQRNGRSTADVIRWNKIDNPDRIEVGQVLRVAPPPGSASAANVDTGSVWRTPSPDRAGTAPSRNAAPAARPRAVPAPAPALPTPAKCGPVSLRLPAAGQVIGTFDGRRNKGIDIGGTDGTPIIAAATGQVAFVGQLRGYGNLLIIKHSNGYLTSYAHLQRATVREGQTVNAGQTIAQMGHTESSRPMLHFELRCNGVPVDPQHSLPGK